MSTEQAKMNEASVRGDITEFISLYSDIDLYGLKQLEKYTDKLTKLSKAYRDTHSQLKKLCVGDEYERHYGHYENDEKRIRIWVKAATARENEEKTREKEDKGREKDELCKKEEKKKHELREDKARKAKIEVKHFIYKVDSELENLVEDAEDLEEIERSILGLETLKEKQNEFQMKCEFKLGDAYEAECIRG